MLRKLAVLNMIGMMGILAACQEAVAPTHDTSTIPAAPERVASGAGAAATARGMTIARTIARELASRGDSSLLRRLALAPPSAGADDEGLAARAGSAVHFEGNKAVGSAFTEFNHPYDRATADADLQVFLGSVEVARAGATDGPYPWLEYEPAGWKFVSAPVETGLSRSCGMTAVIRGYHEAWNGAQSEVRWNTRTMHRAESPTCECGGDQPDQVAGRREGTRPQPTDCDGGGDGGGGGSGVGEGYWVHYTVCWGYHYWVDGVYAFSVVVDCWTQSYFVRNGAVNQSAPPVAGTAVAGGSPPSATVAAVASLPLGAIAVVMRGTGSPSRNLVLVRETATPGELAGALGALEGSRTHRGEAVERSAAIAVPEGVPARALGATASDALTRELRRLRTAAPQHLEGIGTVRAITIPLRARGLQ